MAPLLARLPQYIGHRVADRVRAILVLRRVIARWIKIWKTLSDISVWHYSVNSGRRRQRFLGQLYQVAFGQSLTLIPILPPARPHLVQAHEDFLNGQLLKRLSRRRVHRLQIALQLHMHLLAFAVRNEKSAPRHQSLNDHPNPIISSALPPPSLRRARRLPRSQPFWHVLAQRQRLALENVERRPIGWRACVPD